MSVQTSIVEVMPNIDLQAAVDATPEGGILRLGPGTFTVPDGGLLISRAIEIAGSGMRSTVLSAYSTAAAQPVVRFLVENSTDSVSNVHIHDLQISGGAPAPSHAPARLLGSYGIVIDTHSSGQLLRNISLTRVEINRMSDHGLYVTGNGGNRCVIGLRIESCWFTENWGNGAHVEGPTLFLSTNNLFASNYRMGSAFESCSPTSIGDYWESNCHDQSLTQGYEAQARFYSGVINIIGATWEAFNYDSSNQADPYLRQRQSGSTGTMMALCIQSCSGRIEGCKFYNSASNGSIDERAIFIDNSSTGNAALEIGPCMFDGCRIGITPVGPGYSRGTSIAYQNRHTYEDDIIPHPGLALPQQEAYLISDLLDSPSGNAANVHGQLIFDSTNLVAKLWTNGSWREIVAGQVSYEDNSVMYDDEPVTY